MRIREKAVIQEARFLCDQELLIAALGVGNRSKSIIEKIEKLLRTYPRLASLVQLDIGELASEYHLGTERGAQVQAILEIARRLSDSPQETEPQIVYAIDAVRYVQNDMIYLDHEEMRVLALDTKYHIKASDTLYRGTVNSSVLRAAEIYRLAIVHKCPCIVVLHNHPSGSVEPSPEDVEVTTQLVEAGKLLDIELVDHIIIGGRNKFCSLRERMRWSTD